MVKQAFGGVGKGKDKRTEKAKGKKVNGKGGHRGCETLQLHDDAGGEVCSLVLPPAAPALAGPRINLFLPSFSGRGLHSSTFQIDVSTFWRHTLGMFDYFSGIRGVVEGFSDISGSC